SSREAACHPAKHKERKPKKPHYIPRPWGKPYNYKCFQCPFTCMEKSHLYNHMKYSLCKNSLSLLIESDWPYKKGNILHPDQLRPFQQAHGLHVVEAHLRHQKLPKTCLSAPGLLSEHWRLLASSHMKTKAEGAPARVTGSIPCYPPPPTLVDYQDPAGLNLSMFGVGYPISPSLFSYVNSALPGALPFLASATQLMHPASTAHTDRTIIPSRLYPFLCEHTFGPASAPNEASKPPKTSTNCLDVGPLSGFQPKVNLWKVPALMPGNTVELWCNNPLTSPSSESIFLSPAGKTSTQDSNTADRIKEGASESVAALLTNLSKALQEYQEAEHKISHLEKEDLSAQRHLWEHLSKIRSELSHIHQALERTAVQSDGPLDLSVKRDSTDSAGEQIAQENAGLQDNTTDTEEEEDEELDEKKEDEDENDRKALRASLESRKQSLDMLIKISQASVVNTDVLSPGGLGLRPAEALWPSRTTKCEADSSVLLCPDGRSVMFTDIPSSIKPQKRSPSIHRLESQCPLSPLAVPDS
uniref:Si:ch211-248l17.3 n=1 Tax=Oryzias latipes TaxID=8090 RepID=A0A3P9M6F2_ORYLA